MRFVLTYRSRMVAMNLALLTLAACGGGGGGGYSGGPASGSSSSVVVPPSALSYSSPQTYTVGTAITALIPTIAGTVTSYNVSSALPAGLVLDTINGQITGTPTAVSVATSYTITAQNSGGSTSFALNITVPPLPPSALSYSTPSVFNIGTAITVLNPTVVGTVASYSVLPALPLGLVIDTTSGQITGTPTMAAALTSYTVTAQNSSGATNFTLSITVNPPLPLAATVTVSYDVKQVILNWSAVSGATYYQVLKNPNGAAGYSQLGGNLVSTGYSDTVAVHLVDWLNVSYIVVTCNNVGCTNSAPVNSFDAKQATGYFKALNTTAGDKFGDAVALSADGNTLAVGANSPTNGTGAVYVFTRSSGVWSQAELLASNTDINDNFGAAVALSADGNILIVGAPGESSVAADIDGDQTSNSSSNSGAAYVFRRSNNNWSQQTYIKASNPNANDHFGSAVTLSGDGSTLAVGAYGEASNSTLLAPDQTNNAAPIAGAVYVFTQSGSSWAQQAYIKASNPDVDDEFGLAVTLNADGNTLAVGAYREASNAKGIDGNQADNTASFAGAVYVFTRTGSSWSQQAYVKASNTYTSVDFGYAVALSADGNTLAVGAPQESSKATGINGDQTDTLYSFAGAVYVFTRASNSWSQQTYIKASNTGSPDNFGYAVALSADGHTLAIGARHEASNAKGINGDQTNDLDTYAGAVYVFTWSTGNSSWSQRSYVKASNTDAYDYFGTALAVSADGSTLAVGAYGEASNATDINSIQTDNSATDAGAVYVY